MAALAGPTPVHTFKTQALSHHGNRGRTCVTPTSTPATRSALCSACLNRLAVHYNDLTLQRNVAVLGANTSLGFLHGLAQPRERIHRMRA
jgi:hypothetical protein